MDRAPLAGGRPRRRAGAPTLALALACGAASVACGGPTAGALRFVERPPPRAPRSGTVPCGGPRAVGRLTAPELAETSGLVASRSQHDVLYLHNDSGDPARVFAIDGRGEVRLEVRLAGVSAFDWEAMALGPGPGAADALYVGDLGDNHHVRAEVVVLRFPEPHVGGARGAVAELPARAVERVALVYPGGERPDAEAMLVDDRTGDLYVITKERTQTARVFAARAPWRSGSRALEQVGTVSLPEEATSRLVTDASLAPAGDAILLRTYDDVLLYARGPEQSIAEALAQPPTRLPVPDERQGEAIAFLPDGRGYATISEGTRPPIHAVRLCLADGV